MGSGKTENFQTFLNGLVEKHYVVKNKPVQLMLGLTNVCNLHCAFCPYCGFCSAKIEMAYMLPIELIRGGIKPYLETAQFINPSARGEPLLYRNFEEFMEVCRECDALSSMQLTNNGTQLQRYDLSQMDGVNIIAISIDSVDARTFEILRYGAKLEQVLNNIKRLREALPNTVLQWCVVVNRLNIRQLADIYIAAREMGVNYITFNDVYGYEEDKVIQLLRLREGDRYIVEKQFTRINKLNSDKKMVVNNVISWSGFEDGEVLDEVKIFDELERLKNERPYLNFDELNCDSIESRRIKTENRKVICDKEIRIPYCTNPFEVMFIQPDGSVSPCCASYGIIDKIEGNNVDKVWNGENYQLLREAMFNWDMLPDYCKKCEAFMRYDYIDDFWCALKEYNDGCIQEQDVLIPPNYFPPEGVIRSEELMALIKKENSSKKEMIVMNREKNINIFLTDMMEQKSIVDSNPVQMLIGLTNVCNLHCAFCLYCGFCMKKIQKAEMLPWETLEKLRGYLETASIVIPSGRGEPLVYDKFAEFMQMCRETYAVEKMQLVNNGTLLDRYEPEVFQGVNILSISFDSTNKEVFELLRYGADYDRIISNIQYVRKALPDAVMQFSVTVNRLNMEELSDIYLLASSLGINYISYNSLYGSEEDKVVQLLRLRNSDRKIVEKQMEKIGQLNADGKIEIINVITWPQMEDGELYDKQDIFLRLMKMKNIIPYLDYDELNMYDTSTRVVHEEAKSNRDSEDKKLALPYCTNPYCVFMLQPNEDVSPCCASFGTITNICNKDVDEVWNGKEYQLLREAMFHYDMLPEYCKNCRSFIRYDYINDYIDMLKSQDQFDYDSLVIPPNYFPPEGLIKDRRIQGRIEAQKKLAEWSKLSGSEQVQVFSEIINELYKTQVENDEKINKMKGKLKITEEVIQQKLRIAEEVIQQKNNYIIQAQNMCNDFSRRKLMRINHFIQRLKGQLLHGNSEERKAFRKWLIDGVIKKKGYSAEAKEVYNPWISVRNVLREAHTCSLGVSFQGDVKDGPDLPAETEKILKNDYNVCDVIFLSVIDYNFRFQRPQHLATRFAADGHRVFYVNANFIRTNAIIEEQKNLFIVDFANTDYSAIYSMNGESVSDWMEKHLSNLVNSQAIRDAIVIVDYPNWVYGAEYLRKKYGFKIVTDYMDDYTGFIGTSENFLKDNCICLLKESDLVVASSQFLYEVAVQYIDADKIELIRNGTETEHFYRAFVKNSESMKKKIIGYYGAVAHWFAWEKVCYVAEKFSNCDIVIVGEVTEYREKLEKYKNIKLLGEKSYKELPQYLADFDVCLIPFDASTDLIKATNPVKFYEYLSAGKKVVATEIPELMPYKNEYVYMSNDNKKFTEYVELCLKNEDILKSEQECINFARKNDWQERYSCFKKACISRIPMVSVIVLTYNNLAYNKQCINSILKKTAYANYELIVVDNQSTDGTVEYLTELGQKNIHNLKVILNDANYGFAGGNNIGIREAKGDYILLLNNDTVVTRGWMTAMVKHMEADTKLGMCNPVTNSIGNESKIPVCYHNTKEMNEFAYKITTEKMNEEYRETDSMPLFATLIRRRMIDEIGMLDEAYKVGMFEDDDYLAAAKAAGYDIAIVEDAFIHHINNGSFKRLRDEEYKRIFETNKRYFETKWNRKWIEPKYREGVDWWMNEGMGEEVNGY